MRQVEFEVSQKEEDIMGVYTRFFFYFGKETFE